MKLKSRAQAVDHLSAGDTPDVLAPTLNFQPTRPPRWPCKHVHAEADRVETVPSLEHKEPRSVVGLFHLPKGGSSGLELLPRRLRRDLEFYGAFRHMSVFFVLQTGPVHPTSTFSWVRSLGRPSSRGL